MRGREGFQKPSIRIRRIARGPGLEPFLQIRGAIHNPPPELAVDRPVAIEPELGKRAFGQPDKVGGGFGGNDFRHVCHRESFRSKFMNAGEPASTVISNKGFEKKRSSQK
jgi:hypothetical protein